VGDRTANFTPVSMILAGVGFLDAAKTIIDYFEAKRTWSTIEQYDFNAAVNRQSSAEGKSTRISQSTIDAANYIGAGFSRHYEGSPLDWFAERDQTAPWDRLGGTHYFVTADPVVVGGSYDDMSAVWYHFVDHRPPGIGPTQINKVLHQVRPDVFPIFDRNVNEKYRLLKAPQRHRVREARRATGERRQQFAKDRFGWEPLRLDLERESPKFKEVFRQVATRDCANKTLLGGIPLTQWAAENLSVVRASDIMLWPRRPDPEVELAAELVERASPQLL
jgi:hypothetical protein